MKVILNKDIPNLGEEGDIKDVARGYARNFLIPQDLVMPYSPDALSILESRREQLEQRREAKRKDALDVKTRLETEDLVLEMPAGESGRLFGSVTSANIAEALASKGISVERKRLDVPEKTIKSVGTTRVRVRLYGDEEAELKVIVKASGAKPEAGSEEAKAAPEATSTAAAESADETATEADAIVAEDATAEDATAEDATAEAATTEDAEPSVDQAAETESDSDESTED